MAGVDGKEKNGRGEERGRRSGGGGGGGRMKRNGGNEQRIPGFQNRGVYICIWVVCLSDGRWPWSLVTFGIHFPQKPGKK
jgi:hypothetical protein